jgi:hypothetical protein
VRKGGELAKYPESLVSSANELLEVCMQSIKRREKKLRIEPKRMEAEWQIRERSARTYLVCVMSRRDRSIAEKLAAMLEAKTWKLRANATTRRAQ